MITLRLHQKPSRIHYLINIHLRSLYYLRESSWSYSEATVLTLTLLPTLSLSSNYRPSRHCKGQLAMIDWHCLYAVNNITTYSSCLYLYLSFILCILLKTRAFTYLLFTWAYPYPELSQQTCMIICNLCANILVVLW